MMAPVDNAGMTFGDKRGDGVDQAPFDQASSFEAPYGRRDADGFGRYGPAPDGFGAAASGHDGRQEIVTATTAGPGPVHGPAGHAPTAASAGASGPSAGASGPQVPVSAVPATRLAVPPSIDFGEVVVGEHPTEQRPIYNLTSTPASVVVGLSGSPDFALMSAPTRLRSTGEGASDAPVVIRYLPTKRTESKATLHVHAGWAMGVWPATDVEVPVVGKAYGPGERSHAEEEATAARRDERARAAAAQKVSTDAADRAVEADNRIDDPYPRGAENQLQQEYQRADRALDELTSNQRAGIDAAREEAAAFHRKVPHADRGLLFTLAMFGLDMATAGAAGAVARRVSTVLGKATTGAAVPRLVAGQVVAPAPGAAPAVDRAPEELVAFIADGLKQGLKDAGKAGRKRLGDPASRHDDAGSETPWIDFFLEQTIALNASVRERGNALDHAFQRLQPLLRTSAAGAGRAMAAIADGLAEAAGAASAQQADQSRFAWMRFLSQSALGSLTPTAATALGLDTGDEAAPITDTRGAVAPPREGEAMGRFDGVLDLEFAADYAHPSAPVRLVRASMTGVTPRMADRLRSRQLAEVGVVIRAHGTAPGQANLPITVVRDEVGNIRFTDDTGAAGMPSTWLSRKGGSLQPSPERQLDGARKLMAELMAAPIEELENRGDEPEIVGTERDEDRRP